MTEDEKRVSDLANSLAGKNMDELLAVLHEAQVKQLIMRIKMGEATGAEFAAANQLLKNNNVTVSKDTDNSLDELQQKLQEARTKRRKVQPLTAEETSNIIQMNPFMDRAGRDG